MNLTARQRELLTKMAEGHKIYPAYLGSRFSLVPDTSGEVLNIDALTVMMLRASGMIERVERQTGLLSCCYEITDAGRAALKEGE